MAAMRSNVWWLGGTFPLKRWRAPRATARVAVPWFWIRTSSGRIRWPVRSGHDLQTVLNRLSSRPTIITTFSSLKGGASVLRKAWAFSLFLLLSWPPPPSAPAALLDPETVCLDLGAIYFYEAAGPQGRCLRGRDVLFSSDGSRITWVNPSSSRRPSTDNRHSTMRLPTVAGKR